MRPALFVTGTGTDIGKTFVSCGLLRAWHRRFPVHALNVHTQKVRPLKVRALKPVSSGFDPAQAAESDAGRLLAALGEAVTAESVARVSPWRFAAPLSPDQAAAREGRAIDFDALVAFCRDEAASGPLLVEGVGGVMVPLTARHTTLDWMQQLGWPVLLVSGSYLGTISHTLTALHALAGRGLEVAALVVNGNDPGHVKVADTLASLHRFAPDVPIFALPADPPDPVFDHLAERLSTGPAGPVRGSSSTGRAT
jgi:dethiobiotin synthetase